MSERREKEYRAIIWTKDPERVGKRVVIWAIDLDTAKQRLEEEYGEGTVFALHNEDDANKPR
jgi:hypothetical protein